MPTVSVIIPFCNRLQWTAEAVQSVLDQTFKDFELILIDDGSTDDYRTQIPINDHRIRYYHQKHKGAAAARNLGITMARGRHIAFLDSDDLFLPTKLEEQVAVMESNPEIALSHTSYLQIDEKGINQQEMHSGLFSGFVYPRILTHCPIATPTVMVRADAFQQSLFEEKITVAEDILLWSKLAKISRILGINNALTKVRVHKGSTTLNYRLQIQAVQNLIDYAVNVDKELSFLQRERIMSTMYSLRFYSYYKLQAYGKAAASAILAFFSCPINPDLYSPIMKKILPEYIWNLLRKVNSP